MSTFFLLPPRPFLGQCVAGYLQPLFPKAEWTGPACEGLVKALTTALERRPDVFVVFQEELPEGESAARALADGFGAEAGDQVIEVRSGSKPGELTAVHWQMDGGNC
jgi:hypothetical protein